MSLIYKEPKDVTVSVKIDQLSNQLKMLFTADCGKFGTDEILDEYYLTAGELLEALQGYQEYIDS